MKFENRVAKQNELAEFAKKQVKNQLSKSKVLDDLEGVFDLLNLGLPEYSTDWASDWFNKHVVYLKDNFDILFELENLGYDESALKDDDELDGIRDEIIDNWLLLDKQLVYVKPDIQTFKTTKHITIDANFFVDNVIEDITYCD